MLHQNLYVNSYTAGIKSRTRKVNILYTCISGIHDTDASIRLRFNDSQDSLIVYNVTNASSFLMDSDIKSSSYEFWT